MHPAARVCQILFLLGGVGMFAYALGTAAGNTHTNPVDFRYACTTVNTGTTEYPKPEETCEDEGATYVQHGTDEVMVSALSGIGLMIGAVAVSLGAPRRGTGTGGNVRAQSRHTPVPAPGGPAPAGAAQAGPAPGGGQFGGPGPVQMPGPPAGPPPGAAR